MKKKLKLEKLKVRSFITIQDKNSQKTIVAGAFDSDGPPLTTTGGSNNPTCHAGCNNTPPTETCTNTENCTETQNQYSNICNSGSGGNTGVTH